MRQKVNHAPGPLSVDEISNPVMRPGLGTPGWRQAMSKYHQGTPAFRAARLPSRLLSSRLSCVSKVAFGPIPNLKSGCGNFLTDVDSSASSSRKKGTAMFGAVKGLLSYLAGDPGPRTRANYHNRRIVAAALLTSIATVASIVKCRRFDEKPSTLYCGLSSRSMITQREACSKKRSP